MLNIQTTPFRTTPSESATSKPTTWNAPLQGTDPAGFASLLRQSQGVHASALPSPSPAPLAPAQPDPVPAPRSVVAPVAPAESSSTSHAAAAAKAPGREAQPEPAPGADTAEPPEANEAGGTAARLQARLRGAGSETRRSPKPVVYTAPTEGPQTLPPAAGKAELAATALGPTGDPAVDPTLMQWLAGTQRAVEASRAKASPEPRSTAGGGASTAASEPMAAAGASSSVPASTPQVDATGAERGASDKSTADTGPGTGEFAAILSAQGPIDKLPERQTGAGAGFKDNASIASLAASAATWSLSAPVAAAAPVVVALPTPVGAPEFAQALGVQMSVLAKDGVQHAELHLNPSDMGPVSVQIVMDGSQARVDFGADVAATRQAIEAGLPALASALRDAGFTLTGGGVSQHSRGRGEGGVSAANLRTRRTDSVDADDAPVGVRRQVRTPVNVGGLDLYA